MDFSEVYDGNCNRSFKEKKVVENRISEWMMAQIIQSAIKQAIRVTITEEGESLVVQVHDVELATTQGALSEIDELREGPIKVGIRARQNIHTKLGHLELLQTFSHGRFRRNYLFVNVYQRAVLRDLDSQEKIVSQYMIVSVLT